MNPSRNWTFFDLYKESPHRRFPRIYRLSWFILAANFLPSHATALIQTDSSHQKVLSASLEHAKAHNCPCGSACQGNCCCAGEVAEETGHEPENAGTTQSMLFPDSKDSLNGMMNCGCSVLPDQRFPAGLPENRVRISDFRTGDQACLEIMSGNRKAPISSIFLLESVLLTSQDQDRPPVPPPRD
ncbi:MAG: hypothetical protein RJA81_521 [Planctomycetota bacterium]